MLMDAGLRNAVFAQFHFWKAVADAINPLLGLSLLVVVVRMRRDGAHRDGSRQALRFLVQSVLSLVLAWACVRGLRSLHLGGHGSQFPSGHMAFAVSAALSLILWKRNLVRVLLPLLIFYAWLMTALRFHSWLDLLGGVAASVFVWCLCRSALNAGFRETTLEEVETPQVSP